MNPLSEATGVNPRASSSPQQVVPLLHWPRQERALWDEAAEGAEPVMHGPNAQAKGLAHARG